MYHIKFSKFGGIFMKNITIKELYRNSDEKPQKKDDFSLCKETF